jgi:predicted membrane channel-forming protein YqfA (hemolysin III family)
MGGFRLRDSSGDVYVVNAKHINHLVRKKNINLPPITTLEINDRSKSDSLAKFLAIMQVGWLAVQVITRTIQHLETTTLEITTLSFVVCTLGTFIAWYRKPYDVQTFVIIDMPRYAIDDIDLKYTERGGKERDLLSEYVAGHQTSQVVDHDGRLLAPYNKLTIIDDGQPTFTGSFTDIHGHFWGRTPYDADRIRNDRLPVMEKAVTLVCGITTLAYAGLHIAAWNIPLATNIEQLLWRISALVMMGCVVVWFFMDHLEEYLAHRRARQGKESDGVIVPWWRIPASIVVAIVYGVCRSYVLVESFAAVRKMPPSADQQVDWGRWVPHI